MKEISTQYRLLLYGRYSQKHASDYTRYDAARMKNAVSLLEDDVLEVFFSKKALWADLSGICVDDCFTAQQYCVRQQLEPKRKIASGYDQDT